MEGWNDILPIEIRDALSGLHGIAAVAHPEYGMRDIYTILATYIIEQEKKINQMQAAIVLWGQGYGEEYERGLEDILYKIVEGEYGREQDGDYIHLAE